MVELFLLSPFYFHYFLYLAFPNWTTIYILMDFVFKLIHYLMNEISAPVLKHF